MGSYFPVRFSLFILALVVGVSLLNFQTWAQQTTADPQSLLGEWSGSWKTAGAVQHPQTGRYYLTVEKVEAGKVHGKGRVEGRQAREFNFVGTLTGDRLTFGKDNVADLTISSNQMRGKVQGRVNWDIELNKEK